MVKVNFVTARHKRRKKVLKLAKGYFGSKSNLYKTANEQVMRSLQYAYRDRKQKKRNFRKLWITRINACCKNNNMRYSEFIHGLLLAKVEVNRKILSDMSCNHPEMFIDYMILSQRALKEEKNIKEIKQNKEVVKKQEKQKVNNKQTVKEEDVLNLDSNKTQKKENKLEDIEKKLENTLLSELKILAKKYEIKNINKFKKSDLISLLKEKMLI